MEETIKGGRFIFERNGDQKLGKGGYGKVFNCTDAQGIEQNICIKVIHFNPGALEKQQREVKILDYLRDKLPQYPNLVRMVDYEIGEDKIYIIMEKCDMDLNKFLQERGSLTPEEGLFIIQQIAEGYKVLWNNKILHRDIKLGNILYDKKNNLFKLSDFGLSRLFDCEPKDLSQNIGTRIYSAPELVLGDPNGYTSKVDIYSLGMTFYALIYNKLPFEIRTRDELTIKYYQLKDHPIICCGYKIGLTQQMCELIESMLKFDQSKRLDWEQLYQSPLIKTKIYFDFRIPVSNDRQGPNFLLENWSSVLDNPTLLNNDEIINQWKPLTMINQLNPACVNLSDRYYMIGVLYFCAYQFLKDIVVYNVEEFVKNLKMYLVTISLKYCSGALNVSQQYPDTGYYYQQSIIKNLKNYIIYSVIETNKPNFPQNYFDDLDKYIDKENSEMKFYRKNNKLSYLDGSNYPLIYLQAIYMLEKLSQLTLENYQIIMETIISIKGEIENQAAIQQYLQRRRIR